jgi:hypothetical protein
MAIDLKNLWAGMKKQRQNQSKLNKAYELELEAYSEEMTPEERKQDDIDWWLGEWYWPEAKCAMQMIELCLRLLEDRDGTIEFWPEEHLDILGIERGDLQPGQKIYVQGTHEPALHELQVMEACTMLHLKGQQMIDHRSPRLDSYAEWRASHGTNA